MNFRVVHLELNSANELVKRWHRHHKPVIGHRFSLGVVDEKGELHGACIVGRPIARLVNYESTVEITRLVTDGTYNACSALYGAAARAAKALGYEKIQTYILETEPGISLRAAGWTYDGQTNGGQWKHSDGKPRRMDQPVIPKQRWIKLLRKV